VLPEFTLNIYSQKLESFTKLRRRNWALLREALAPLEDRLILPEPCPNSDPSWFGFLITCRDGGRDRMVATLEGKRIQTRMLFAGNILRQPCFDHMREAGKGFRVVGDLTNTDRIMNSTFWLR